MKRIIRIFAKYAAILLLCASPILAVSPAEAQTVQQSGSVTQNHIATWATNGVIKDGGAVAANQSLMGGSSTTTAASTTVYCASAGCGASVATASQVPFTGTLSNLSASVATAPGTGHSVVVTVYTGVYGSATASALTCTIANTATSCTDTSHQVNLPLGTSWTIQFAVGASATSTGGQAGSVQFTSSAPPTPTTPYVLQSGQVTSGHAAGWITNGVIGDIGSILVGTFVPNDFVSVNANGALIDSGFSSVSGGGTINFLRADGTWTPPPPLAFAAVGASGASRAFSNSDCGTFVKRSNSGGVMTDTLPSTPLTTNCIVYVQNTDTTGFYGVQAAGSNTLCSPQGAIAGSPASGCVTAGYLLLGPGQSVGIQSDGVGSYAAFNTPARAKLAPGTTLTFYYTGGTCSNSNMPLSQSTPWCDPQQCWNYSQANLDIGNNKGGTGILCQQLDSTVTASNSQGGSTAALNAAGTIPGQNTLIGFTVQGNCTTPANTVLLPTNGVIIVADDGAQLAITCMTVQTGLVNGNIFVSQHGAFLSINDKVFVSGGAQTGTIFSAATGGAIIKFFTLTIANGNNSTFATFQANFHSRIEMNGTVTWTTPSNPASGATYQAGDDSMILASGITYNGSPTITNKYSLSNGGFLNTGGACAGVPGTGTSVDGFSNCH